MPMRAVILLVAVLVAATAVVSAQGTTTCDFTILSPNTTFPNIGVFINGTLTYNNTAYGVAAYPNYPPAYALLNVSATRTVWQSTRDNPNTFTTVTTSEIVGVVLADDQTFLQSNSSSSNGTAIPVSYGTSKAGAFFDNLIYPQSSVPDHMDFSGWYLNLSTPQAGAANGGTNLLLFANDAYAGGSGDISDDDDPNPNVSQIPQSFFGTMTLDCPAPLGSALGDPQFSGLRGQSFQVHGIDGAVYAIISERDLQMNARFAFLDGPRRCPILPMSGRQSRSCWTHPGSYLSQVGLKTASGRTTLRVIAGDVRTGFALVEYNGRPLNATSANAHIRVLSSHELVLTVGDWTIELENIDGFINLSSAQLAARARAAGRHGLIGQTALNKRYESPLKVIEGIVDDYVITNGDLLGHDFTFTNYHDTTTTN